MIAAARLDGDQDEEISSRVHALGAALDALSKDDADMVEALAW
ncbi:hypothetical protein [Nocardia sp. NPDC050435]